MSLLNFASVDDLENFLRSEDYLVVVEDEQRMVDVNAGEWWTSISMTIVNRISSEKTTLLD